MEVIACTCPLAYGLPHSHTPTKLVLERKSNGQKIVVPDTAIDPNWYHENFELVEKIAGDIRVWINWKAVCRAIMTEEEPQPA